MTEINGDNYWGFRVHRFDNQEWARSSEYLRIIIEYMRLSKDDVVLDVGTGTGIVARAIAPSVKNVFAIDTSEEMLVFTRKETDAINIVYRVNDVRNLEFRDESFTKVVARMVFHHILQGQDKALKECFRVLKPKGLMIWSSGVPPDHSCRKLYDEVFALKEKRVSFMPEEIKNSMENAGFKKVKLITYWMRGCSIRKWLEDSVLPESIISKILSMYVDANQYFKKACNMKIVENDVVMDWKFIIAVGMKKI